MFGLLVWGPRLSPYFCAWPEAKRNPSGGRQLSPTSGDLLDPAPAFEAETLLLGEALVFPGSPAVDLEVLVFEGLVAVLSDHDGAFENLADKFERHIVSLAHIVVLVAPPFVVVALGGTQALLMNAVWTAGQMYD